MAWTNYKMAFCNLSYVGKLIAIMCYINKSHQILYMYTGTRYVYDSQFCQGSDVSSTSTNATPKRKTQMHNVCEMVEEQRRKW